MLRGTWYNNKEIKVENGLESAKIVTNVQTFRDCTLHRENTGDACVSSFVSGHASRAASMLIFSSFEVCARVHNATFYFKSITSKRGFNTLTNISTDEGHSPETSGHLLLFWHFLHRSQLLFP